MRSWFLCLLFLLGVSGDILSTIQQKIFDNDRLSLATILLTNKSLANARSADGRGPAWWAMETGGDPNMVGLLVALGSKVLTTETDRTGLTPIELLKTPPSASEMDQWVQVAQRAFPVLADLRLRMIGQLEDELDAAKALDEELDSYDD